MNAGTKSLGFAVGLPARYPSRFTSALFWANPPTALASRNAVSGAVPPAICVVSFWAKLSAVVVWNWIVMFGCSLWKSSANFFICGESPTHEENVIVTGLVGSLGTMGFTDAPGEVFVPPFEPELTHAVPIRSVTDRAASNRPLDLMNRRVRTPSPPPPRPEPRPGRRTEPIRANRFALEASGHPLRLVKPMGPALTGPGGGNDASARGSIRTLLAGDDRRRGAPRERQQDDRVPCPVGQPTGRPRDTDPGPGGDPRARLPAPRRGPDAADEDLASRRAGDPGHHEPFLPDARAGPGGWTRAGRLPDPDLQHGPAPRARGRVPARDGRSGRRRHRARLLHPHHRGDRRDPPGTGVRDPDRHQRARGPRARHGARRRSARSLQRHRVPPRIPRTPRGYDPGPARRGDLTQRGVRRRARVGRRRGGSRPRGLGGLDPEGRGGRAPAG